MKDKEPSSFVFKLRIHCVGCAEKIEKVVRKFDGVESVKADMLSNRVMVNGKVDPDKLRDRLEAKLNRKISMENKLYEVISKEEDESLSKEEEDKSLSEEEEEEDKLLHSELSWREALRWAANIAGFVVLNSKNESQAVKDIVEKITHLLDKTEFFVADKPVGVDSRVQDVIQLLDMQQSNDVLLLGMFGMGGIGKTTIAKAIYNEIGRNFEENGISVLVERSLVTINDKNKLGMHDLLRDMGREIICNESRKEPEERSRLWCPEDVDGVLAGQTGTKSVEGLALELPRDSPKCYSTKAFKKMKKLRLLQLSGVKKFSFHRVRKQQCQTYVERYPEDGEAESS
ncbi:hypothetical protein P8452_50366 [Trifolium repens]|nr:hypothetical protein P8452_50366 [Trifolium repens]